MSDYLKNDIFGSYQLACECLNDEERTIALRDSIKRLVQDNKIVLELGAGTGILSMFAAKYGAEKVYAVEIAKPVADIALDNIKLNELDDIINVINHDALTLEAEHVPEKPDLIIMEMITTGLIEELQVPAFNNLIKKGITSNRTVSSPSEFKTYASLAEVDYVFYGFKIKAILHQESWQRNIIKEELTKRELVSHVNFNVALVENKVIDPGVKKVIEFVVDRPGLVNALLLNSEAILDNNETLGWTTALNTPVIVPLVGNQIKTGDIVSVEVEYNMGEGLENLRAKLL